MHKILNSRDMSEIQGDYDQKYSAMTTLVNAAKEAGRDLSPDEVTKFDSLDCEIRALAAEKAKVEKHVAAVADINARIVDGSIDVPDYLKPSGGIGSRPGSQLRSKSGKPLAIAAGPSQRLNPQPKGGHLIGELIRAGAVGVTQFTPDSVRMALRSDDNSKGGYSVPDEWLTTWVDRAIEQTSVAAYCTRILMDSESTNITTIVERPTVATKAELEKFTDQSMAFGSSRLQAFTCGATLQASMELLEDSPNAAQQIEMASIKGLIDWFNLKLLNGSGSSEPSGILNRGGIPGTGSVGDINWDAIADGVTALRSEIYVPNLCVVSPAVFNQLHLQRELDAGDGAYLPRPEHLKDLNVVASSHCPDSKVVIGDFLSMVIGIRQGARVEVSSEAGESFERNAVLIRMKMRADWVPSHNQAFYILSDVTVPA